MNNKVEMLQYKVKDIGLAEWGRKEINLLGIKRLSAGIERGSRARRRLPLVNVSSFHFLAFLLFSL